MTKCIILIHNSLFIFPFLVLWWIIIISNFVCTTCNCECWTRRFEEDIWTEIAKFLDGKSLVMLAATSRWFRRAIMDDGIWKFVCLRDLQVPPPECVAFRWCKLYTSTFGKTSPLFNVVQSINKFYRLTSIFEIQMKFQMEATPTCSVNKRNTLVSWFFC